MCSGWNANKSPAVYPLVALGSSLKLQGTDSNDWVQRMALQALSGLHQQYPHKIDHLWSESDGSLQSPEVLHPAFYGNYDWHSSVHSHWALVRLLLRFPEDIRPLYPAISAALERNINTHTIAAEASYLRSQATFERPYGWGWLLRLAAECGAGARTAPDAVTRTLLGRLAAALEPAARAVRDGWLTYLPKLGEPLQPAPRMQRSLGAAAAIVYRLFARLLARLDGEGCRSAHTPSARPHAPEHNPAAAPLSAHMLHNPSPTTPRACPVQASGRGRGRPCAG